MIRLNDQSTCMSNTSFLQTNGVSVLSLFNFLSPKASRNDRGVLYLNYVILCQHSHIAVTVVPVQSVRPFLARGEMFWTCGFILLGSQSATISPQTPTALNLRLSLSPPRPQAERWAGDCVSEQASVDDQIL